MSDFYGALSSTSFRVKDKAKFLADPDTEKLKKIVTDNDGFFEDENGYFSFGWLGQYPSWIIQEFDDDGGELPEFNICTLIAAYILPGDICRIGISGNEKLRYIGGGIVWISSQGIAYFEGTTEWSTKITTKSLAAQMKQFSREVRGVVR